MPAKSFSNVPTARPPAGGEVARRRIVAGARTYFFAHGFRGVTMDDLAAELGMSKKTLYAHFSSKMALLEAVMADKFSHVEADLARVTAENPSDFPARLQALLACMRSHTDEIGVAYIRDVRREAPELFAQVQARRRELIQRFFGKLLQDGRKAGMIRKDIPATMMIEMLLGAVDSVVNPAKMEELGSTPKEAFYQIITIFLEGVVIKERSGKS
jgi:AcrR family transcriptional regulator